MSDILGIVTVSFYKIRNDVDCGIFQDRDRSELIDPTYFHQYLETPDIAQLRLEFRYRFRPLSKRTMYVDIPISRKDSERFSMKCYVIT